jgi:hypothetical protein
MSTILRRIRVAPGESRDTFERSQRLAGVHSVPIDELLSPDFLAQHSRFASFAEMRRDMDLEFVREAAAPDEKAAMRERWESAVREATSFPDWESMRSAAAAHWVQQRLRDDSPWSDKTSPLPPRPFPGMPSSKGESDRTVPDASFIPTEVDGNEIDLAGYRLDFTNVLEKLGIALPEWKIEVHHTKVNFFREAFAEFDKINIDDLRYTRGVPYDVHREITSMQNTTRSAMYKELGVPDNVRAMQKFRKNARLWKQMKEKYLEPMERKIDQLWGDYMIDATKGKAAILKKMNAFKKYHRRPALFKVLVAKNKVEVQKFFKSLGIATKLFALVGVITAGIKRMEAIYATGADPTSEQAIAFNRFLTQYTRAVDIVSEREMTLDERNHFMNALTSWLFQIGIDVNDSEHALLNRELELWSLPGHEARF